MSTTTESTVAPLAGAPSALRRLAGWAVLALALLAVAFWNLGGPQLWWDEGWTLSVARHWAEEGFYGRLRGGERVGPGLEASFTTTLPVGLTMRALGVGVWQGRVFGAVTAVAAVLLMAALAARLYGRRVAVATVVAALLLTIHPQIHPLLQGRQVLAEMPMLMYLLAGYLCLWWALAGRWLAVLPAALLLGLAWTSKAQVGPFLAASLAVTALVALAWRRWAAGALVVAAFAGAYVGARLLSPLVYGWLRDPSVPVDPVDGVTGMVAMVLTPFHRAYAAQNLLMFGLPAVLGLLWGLWALWRDRGAAEGAPAWLMRLALLAFCGSWLAWFLALSVGVPRYMAPPALVASLFVAAMLHDLTGGFAIAQSLRALTDLLTLRRVAGAGWAAMLALLLVIGAGALTTLVLATYYPEDDRAAERVAALLNAMPPGTRIETYESELHFLLDQSYTYPPDQLHVSLGLRSLLVDPDAPVVYDPLANDSDYLVVGRFARENELYAPAIAGGAFRLVEEDGLYEVYERVW